MICEQEKCFGRHSSSLQGCAPHDVTDLNHAVRRIDPHQGLSPLDPSARLVHDRKEQRIG